MTAGNTACPRRAAGLAVRWLIAGLLWPTDQQVDHLGFGLADFFYLVVCQLDGFIAILVFQPQRFPWSKRYIPPRNRPKLA
jgi:hypothetical protein